MHREHRQPKQYNSVTGEHLGGTSLSPEVDNESTNNVKKNVNLTNLKTSKLKLERECYSTIVWRSPVGMTKGGAEVRCNQIASILQEAIEGRSLI